MNIENGRAPDPPARIVLTRENDIEFGHIVIRPSAREVCFKGAAVTLEPRVMQVLVALARTPGEVVTRDQLVERCWEGRIIGDDAITRCVGLLRKLAHSCENAFEIETLSKVGYKLALAGPGQQGDRVEAPVSSTNVAFESRVRAADTSSQQRRSVWTARLARHSATFAPALLTAAAIILLLAADPFAHVSNPQGWRVDNVRSFASTPLLERDPAFSPNGRFIAFSRGHNNRDQNIFVQALDGADALQVTGADQSPEENDDKSSPVWSPDGSQIAFLIRPDNTPCRIALKAFPRGTAREIGRCIGATKGRLAWMPQGDALIHIDKLRPSEPYRLMKLDLTSGKSLPLTEPPSGSGDWGASVSPDGKFLMFVREREEKPRELDLLDLDTNNTRLIETGVDIFNGAWSPDSKTFFFVHLGDDGQLRLKATYLSDGHIDVLYVLPGGVKPPMSGRNGWLALPFERSHLQLAYAPVVGEKPEIIGTGTEHALLPVFSNQGALAFAVLRGGQVTVRTLEAGNEPREMTAWAGSADNLCWSPSGKQLAVALYAKGRSHLRVIGKDGLSMREIALDGHYAGQMGWLSEQRILVPVLKEKWRTLIVDVGTGAVTSEQDTNGDWDGVQVRGDEIYATRAGAAGLWRLDGAIRRIADSPPAHPPFQRRVMLEERHWKVVGDDIVFPSADGQSLLAQHLRGSGQQRVMARTPGSTSLAFDINPVTQRAVYQLGPSDTDIMLLHLSPN